MRLGRLREVDGLDGALAGALAAERAGLEVDGADHAAVVELREDRLLAGFGRLDLTDRLAGAAVDARVGDDVGERADAHLEVAGVAGDRLDGGAAVDAEVRVVDGDVAVEALARAGLRVGGGQALAAVVGGEHGADAGGPAAEERPPLDQLDVVAHLGELGGGLRAGHAAADHHDGVVALGVAHRVRRGVRVGDRRVDDAGGLVGDRVHVVAVDPAAALADIGDLELEAARQELLEAARGEVGGAAGEDELPAASPASPSAPASMSSSICAWPTRLHQWVPRSTSACRPACCSSRSKSMLVERAGALAEEHERARWPLPSALMRSPSRRPGRRRRRPEPARRRPSAAAPRSRRRGSRARRCRSPGTSRRRR